MSSLFCICVIANIMIYLSKKGGFFMENQKISLNERSRTNTFKSLVA